MKTALCRFILLWIMVPLAKADSASPGRGAPEHSAVAVTVSGLEVRAAVAENGHDVTMSVNGKENVNVELPKAESVSEVRIGRWANAGIALAIETRNPETKECTYFWSTVWVNPQDSTVNKPVVSRFLRSKIDYDVVGVVNNQGDSICITLLRYQRSKDSQSVDGQIYVNNCPVVSVAKGVLFPIAVDSTVVQSEP